MSNDFLKNVIFKVDFLDEIKLSSTTIDKFQDDFSDDFPSFKPEDMVLFEMTMGQVEKTTKEKRFKIFSFNDDTIGNTIRIEPKAIIIDVKNYSTFDEFKQIILKTIQILEPENSSAIASRIGLRYINQLIIDEGNPFDWNEIIKEPLTSMINFVEIKEELSRLIGVIELNRSDYFIRFQYGWFNSEYPSPIAKKEFVLDYDCYSEDEIGISSIFSQVELFHRAIKKLFKDSMIEGDNHE